ncbi:MAG: hypothetical protein ABH864_07030 [archaeon]
MEFEQKKLVEAIEEGRIVRVPEQYAKREGLLILKRPAMQVQQSQTPSYLEKRDKDRTKPLTEYIRSKPDWREKQVMSELVENFHWQIRYNRRRLGLTRRQLAKAIDVADNDLQLIESGRLPTKDFILINKIQKALGINLRKDGKEFDLSTQEIMEKAQEVEMQKLQQKRQTQFRTQTQSRSRSATKPEEDYDNELVGQGIEILEDEI